MHKENRFIVLVAASIAAASVFSSVVSWFVSGYLDRVAAISAIRFHLEEVHIGVHWILSTLLTALAALFVTRDKELFGRVFFGAWYFSFLAMFFSLPSDALHTRFPYVPVVPFLIAHAAVSTAGAVGSAVFFRRWFNE
ncbi:MAG: hypothetical protein HY897_08240 [Deltaproteobacteria bacterium]|nr:hypothetical protein [Deltaproteobacteria bacterium]